jgi:hypothetical protein
VVVFPLEMPAMSRILVPFQFGFSATTYVNLLAMEVEDCYARIRVDGAVLMAAATRPRRPDQGRYTDGLLMISAPAGLSCVATQVARLACGSHVCWLNEARAGVMKREYGRVAEAGIKAQPGHCMTMGTGQHLATGRRPFGSH